MEKVKTKLAVWSWAREQGLDAIEGRSSWIPLFDPDRSSTQHGTSKCSPINEDSPFNPPNSKHTSVPRSLRQNLTPMSGVSPGQSRAPSPLSAPRSIHVSDEDEEERPLELRAKASPNRIPFKSHFTPPKYLNIPIASSPSTPTSHSEPQTPFPRALSNLGTDETRFKAHRNSIDLIQLRHHDEGKLNSTLMNSQDSMILARSKFNEKYPTASLDLRPAWSRADLLSRISDASPSEELGMQSMRQLEALSAAKYGKVE